MDLSVGKITDVDILSIQIVLGLTVDISKITLKEDVCSEQFEKHFNFWLKERFGTYEVAYFDQLNKKLHVGQKFWSRLMLFGTQNVLEDDWFKNNVKIFSDGGKQFCF